MQGYDSESSIDAPEAARVLCVYGSETGNARRAMYALDRYWRDKADPSEYLMQHGPPRQANALASLHQLKSECDVLIVATSSFGEGDPPANFVDFLTMLVRAAKAASHDDAPPPLEGMQHAVLGFGQSVYPTYQNCPRWTDKLLCQLGSRRLVKRVELDEGPDDDAVPDEREFYGHDGGARDGSADAPAAPVTRSAGLTKFRDSVHAALQMASMTRSLPAQGWHDALEPQVFEKSEAELQACPQIVSEGPWPASTATAAAVAAVTVSCGAAAWLCSQVLYGSLEVV